MAVDYLNARGFHVERRRTTGIEDCGDLSGLTHLVIEVKSGGLPSVSGGLHELEIEVANADKRFPSDAPHSGIVIARKKGTSWPGDWFCCMTLEKMVDLLKAAGFQ
jgi:hypothetical protein